MVDRLVRKGQAHNAVLGLRSVDGRVDAAAAAGPAGVSDSAPMTVNTPYFLASITKMYTATVIMQLAEMGEIDLDAPASRYLGAELLEGIHVIDGTDYGGRITVAQLLNQTSGLADYFEGKPRGGRSLVEDLLHGHDRALGIEEIVEMVRRLEPRFVPGAGGGAKAYYSDTNYALLGAIIEAATGNSVADNFHRRIFTVLGLSNTYVFDHTQAQPPPAATYFKDRALEIPLAMSSFAPDGGVVSTLDESLRFLHSFFGGELLGRDQLAFMTGRWNRIFFPLQYGSGLMRFALPRWMAPFKAPPELIGHSGSTGSFAFLNRDRGMYAAGTINQMDDRARPYRIITQMIDSLD